MLHKELTGQIIESFYKVYNKLGYGFLEKVYENALCAELKNQSLGVISQFPIQVYYKNEPVGEYFADILVEDKVIVELKAAEFIRREHEFQLINYLKATKAEVGILLNFGRKPDFKRKIYTNTNKNQRKPVRSV
ncbi:MAG: GxxExxY protein [Balneolaceae bacterium]|nr:GxxExxY protein [Balneolaceae bacterium]